MLLISNLTISQSLGLSHLLVELLKEKLLFHLREAIVLLEYNIMESYDLIHAIYVKEKKLIHALFYYYNELILPSLYQ